jgi:hypothetical protein
MKKIWNLNKNLADGPSFIGYVLGSNSSKLSISVEMTEPVSQDFEFRAFIDTYGIDNIVFVNEYADYLETNGYNVEPTEVIE